MTDNQVANLLPPPRTGAIPINQPQQVEQIDSQTPFINNSHIRQTSTVARGCFHFDLKSGRFAFQVPLHNNSSFGRSGISCLTQLKQFSFYQALISEFVGTMFLTLFACSTGLPIGRRQEVPDLHGILVGGLTLSTLIVCFGHVSGCNINPAVTLSLLFACHIDIIRTICYIAVQLLGAFCGSCLLKSLAPTIAREKLGVTNISEGVTVQQAFIVELIITFILCYTILAACDKNREDVGGSKALSIGIALIIGSLFGGPYSGGSMNPARSFGPAAVAGIWKNHWIYWFGPITGGVAAAICYNHILKQRIIPQPVVESYPLKILSKV
ncbi:unnamed protein product [Didymodactylos carnosus]|uniref:Aquaporin n=1 Tax=Didymodactylos carnosus TaxID=1234261 RepID=A0A813W7M1_9BILA|nr:unnamed protein product [Didymodactylos carnosus]CAF1066271.1 unnamed protein product [Didymodactylos carnosus]CAF3641281.1 unnamed protein product [Didymodactylos carnosus]CAF3831252.1 unnamed protein product [Didymodactylos carnosus]